MMAPVNNKTALKRELRQAIARFIDRQRLVAQAMRDLGLDIELVGEFGALAWTTTDLESQGLDLSHFRNKKQRALYDQIQQNTTRQLQRRGFWGENDEWKYELHGSGCLLTNSHTGEPIDWDCPDVLAFDPFFFLCHLAWQLESPQYQPMLRHTQRWVERNGLDSITAFIDEMTAEGLIAKHPIEAGVKYILASK